MTTNTKNRLRFKKIDLKKYIKIMYKYKKNTIQNPSPILKKDAAILFISTLHLHTNTFTATLSEKSSCDVTMRVVWQRCSTLPSLPNLPGDSLESITRHRDISDGSRRIIYHFVSRMNLRLRVVLLWLVYIIVRFS